MPKKEVTESPSYYGILPANIRYDNRLKPMEKILYSEITALSNKTGECWSSNKYFADLYDVTQNTVSIWVCHLVELGHINRRIKYKENSKQIESRYLSLSIGGTTINDDTPTTKKEEDNNTSNNNINLINNDHFKKFWEIYPRKTAKANAQRAYLKALKKSTPQCIFASVLAHTKSKQWQDKQYIPHAATWLNGERWEDEIIKSSSGAYQNKKQDDKTMEKINSKVIRA